MMQSFTKDLNEFDMGTGRESLISGTKDEDYGTLYVAVRQTCDQEKRDVVLGGSKKDGFALFELTAHFNGINYKRRFHLSSGSAAIIPCNHLENISLQILEFTGSAWRAEADLLPRESCSATPTPLLLWTEDAPGIHRVPEGAHALIPQVADPNFHWRTRFGDTPKVMGVLSVPALAGVEQTVLSGFYATTQTMRVVWRISS